MMHFPITLLLGIVSLVDCRHHLDLESDSIRVRAPEIPINDLGGCDFKTVMAGGDWVRNSDGVIVSDLQHVHDVDTPGADGNDKSRYASWRHVNCSLASSTWPVHVLNAGRHHNPLRKLLFLGDSTMGYLHKAFSQYERLRCFSPYRRQEDRCSLDRYYDVPAPHGWPHGKRKLGEGPFKVGLTQPGCLDCSGCSAMAQKCAFGTEVEYIPMEHARDKTVSSDDYPTSQTVLLRHYLAQDPADVVILNLGLHGMSMCSFDQFEEYFPGRFDECWENRSRIFQRDVKDLVRRIQKSAKLVVWVSISAINDELQDISRVSFSNNNSSNLFNAAANNAMAELGVPVVDVSRMSGLPYAISDLHTDPVHLRAMNDLYYNELAAMVAQAISQSMYGKENAEASVRQRDAGSGGTRKRLRRLKDSLP